jgi:hypothetical protein
VTLEDIEFSIRVVPQGELDKVSEWLNLMGRQFKFAQKGLKLQEIQVPLSY